VSGGKAPRILNPDGGKLLA